MSIINHIDHEKRRRFITMARQSSIEIQQQQILPDDPLYTRILRDCWECGVPYISPADSHFEFPVMDSDHGSFLAIRCTITGLIENISKVS